MRREPDLVDAARRLAAELEFGYSSSDGTGRLLATLVGAACAAWRAPGPPIVAESGTGCGFGTAWLRSELPSGARLVTVEHDPVRAPRAAALFDDDAAVTVLAGDWRLLAGYAPFGLLFLDGGGKRDGPDAVADLVTPGGMIVMDDFTPCDDWPPTYLGEPDTLRLAWLTEPRFATAEVRVSATEAVLIATRRRA